MASQAAPSSVGGRAGRVVVSVAAALVILGVSILPFLTPAWIHGEQDRAGVPALFGGYGDIAHGYSDQIVHDLVLGGPFEVSTGRLMPLLDAKEQTHMRDVRAVFDVLAVLVLAGAAVLFIAARRSRRDATARQALWRATSRGARGLAAGMAVVGILAIVAFDAAFQVFHELLFPAGSFSFDPATEQLVRLYPDQFWSDTTLALGLVAFGLAIVVAVAAGRRARGATSGAPAITATASPLSPSSVP